MEDSILRVFSESTEKIFSEIGFSKLHLMHVDENGRDYEVIASIGITGDISGYLSLRTDLSTAHAFIGRLLRNLSLDTEEEEFGRFHREALGEIVNQVSGRSSMLLEEKDYHCNITPPTILIGENMEFSPRDLGKTFNTDIIGDFGSINLFVGVQSEKHPVA
jgi:chemotaxis protein CheX